NEQRDEERRHLQGVTSRKAPEQLQVAEGTLFLGLFAGLAGAHSGGLAVPAPALNGAQPFGGQHTSISRLAGRRAGGGGSWPTLKNRSSVERVRIGSAQGFTMS